MERGEANAVGPGSGGGEDDRIAERSRIVDGAVAVVVLAVAYVERSGVDRRVAVVAVGAAGRRSEAVAVAIHEANGARTRELVTHVFVALRCGEAGDRRSRQTAQRRV